MRKHLFLLMLLAAWIWMPFYQQVQASNLESKNILILNSYHSGFEWTDDQTKGVLSSMSDINSNVNISIEYMDWKRYPTENNLNNTYQNLKDKYALQTTDVIICTDDAAYFFALKYRSEIFSNAPIVFCGVNSTGIALAKDESNYTGVLEEINPEDTIKAALKINPNIKDVYLLYDNTESGISTGELCINAVNKIDSTLNIISYNQKSSSEILTLLSQINPNSMILITTYFTDVDGSALNHQAFCEELSEVSPVPIYHLYDFALGDGILGGYLTSGMQQGIEAGNIAKRILNGEKADDIPILDLRSNQFTYDYLVSQKYEIIEKSLPLNSQIIHKPFSFLETYRTLVMVVLLIFFLLIIFTAILLFYIRKINKMKYTLAENNEELSQLYEELSATEEELRAQVTDITDAHEQLEEYSGKLHHLAYHDTLTGLYNRLYLYEEIGGKLKDTLYAGALYFIDLDNFKFVNDALGHNIGDELLKAISNRLLALTSENIALIRLGGDEFVFFASEVKSKEIAEQFAGKIIEIFTSYFDINENRLSVSVSIGIAMFPENGGSIDSLLRNSDMAMFKVKNNGKNGYYFFNNQLKEELLERVNIEKNFKNALEKEEFIIYYQPQIHTESDDIDGFEALIRWNNCELGMLSPLKFISIAEETGFITFLGEWILRTACTTIANLNKRLQTAFNISVNISVIQLVQDDFVKVVKDVLKETGLSPELLELEITESVIMESQELVTAKIKILRRLGIKIAIDDFGTGYSSLSYLRNIPITTLKIDKLFVDDIANPASNTDVTDTIIDLGHKMNLTIVAEGVETRAQLIYLQENGCDKIQGYFYSKPLPIKELEEFIGKYQFGNHL